MIMTPKVPEIYVLCNFLRHEEQLNVPTLGMNVIVEYTTKIN